MRTPTLVLLIACCATPVSAQKHQPKANSQPAPKQTESPKAAAKPASDAEQDENESQGPWRGLQYRLVGPFRGGRVVAVSGVVGEDDVYTISAPWLEECGRRPMAVSTGSLFSTRRKMPLRRSEPWLFPSPIRM